MSKKVINKIILDSAEAVSNDVETAEEYLSAEGVDIESFISRGLKELDIKEEKKVNRSKSQNYFHRMVLGAKIADECHKEWAFGSVKFQKLVYLCEHVSQMNFTTNYSKQAAGPFDNKFMHSVKKEFEKQGWFKVEKVSNGKFSKVEFTPMEKLENYKSYFQKYFGDVEDSIQTLIEIFRKSKTDEVELVATIFGCWSEINDQNVLFSENLVVEKVYAWHEKKKKFSKEAILSKITWMKDQGLTPIINS